jgi:hypothetical protein
MDQAPAEVVQDVSVGLAALGVRVPTRQFRRQGLEDEDEEGEAVTFWVLSTYHHSLYA